MTLLAYIRNQWPARLRSRIGRLSDRLRSEDGSSLVEFALTFTGMMAFVFVMMEICVAFYSYGLICDYACEGTRYAIVRGSTCVTSSSSSCTATTTSVTNYVKGLGLPNIGGGTINVTTTYPDTNENPGSRVRVAITYTVAITMPLVPRNSISLQTASEMYILQ
jgi:Flp pilus assembly protein TadG